MSASTRPITVANVSGASVSTLTSLTGWLKLDYLEEALFSLQNTDATNNVFLRVETSQDGSRPDVDGPSDITVTPGTQGSVEIGPRMLRLYWRVSAYTQTPAFPTVVVNYQVTGLPR